MSNPWETSGTPEFLQPNPPSPVPEPQSAGDGMTGTLPFVEPQDHDSSIRNLILDRPLKLFIPRNLMHAEYEYRIINSIPSEIADAHNKGFKAVTNPEVAVLFNDLVAGTDKDGKAFRPILCARPKVVGAHVRKRNRMTLASLYAGMDPSNKEFQGKYTDKVNAQAGTKGQFSGPAFRIKV